MDISDWRKRIDGIDEKLVELLNQRAHAAAAIGKLKRAASEPVYQPQRENEVLERVQKLNAGPLSNQQLRRLFKCIVDEARAVERGACDKKDPE